MNLTKMGLLSAGSAGDSGDVTARSPETTGSTSLCPTARSPLAADVRIA